MEHKSIALTVMLSVGGALLAIALISIAAPIVLLTADNRLITLFFDCTRNNHAQYQVVPLDTGYNAPSVLSHGVYYTSWPKELTAGLVATDAKGSTRQGTQVELPIALERTTVEANTAYQLAYLGLAGGSTIRINYTSSGPTLLLLVRRSDMSVPTQDNPRLDYGNTTIEYSSHLRDIALEEAEGTNVITTMAVPGTDQYVLLICNTGRMDVMLSGFSGSATALDPTAEGASAMLSSCSIDEERCNLDRPGSHKDKYVSVVVYTTCAKSEMLFFDVNLGVPVSSWYAIFLGYMWLVYIGVLLMATSPLVYFGYDHLARFFRCFGRTFCGCCCTIAPSQKKQAQPTQFENNMNTPGKDQDFQPAYNRKDDTMEVDPAPSYA